MSVQTIDEMIQLLEEARDNMGGDTPIRVAYQESYPLMGTVANVTVPEEPDNRPHCGEHIFFIPNCSECKLELEEAIAAGYDPDDPETYGGDSVEQVRRKQLWIAVGSAPYDENPYGPRWAWQG